MKSFIKRFVRFFGLDVIRYNEINSESAHLYKMLIANNINLIFDIGANTGQFGTFLRDSGYKGKIVSFEPLNSAWNTLLKTSKGYSSWEVHPRCAIGESHGSIQINISGNSVSSSVLKMLDSHSNAAPDSSYVGYENVPLRKLDELAEDYLNKDTMLFLKIDTQGNEWQVLNGAEKTLESVKGVMIEISLIPLYEGQRLWRDILDRLEFLGFELWALYPVFIDKHTGKTLQVDAVFFR
jgi:FkbM family methyltransferase